MPAYKLVWGQHSLELGKRSCIMGILNVTPDSFSDGGKYFTADAAVAHGEKLAQDGADIIDVGGESTRPFSETVSFEEEIQRVIPVIEKLAKRVSIPISIDTTKAGVAEMAMEAGASIINDISSMRFDDNMVKIAIKYDVPVILMHMLQTPETMQVSPEYDDVIVEVRDFLEKRVNDLEKKGVSRSKIIIDPGIGFGKKVEHNLMLIDYLHRFTTLDMPLLIGLSRKSFIQNLLKDANCKNVNSGHLIVETGTQAAIAAAVLHGAHIIRVHDVAKTRITLKIIDAIKTASDILE